MITPEEIEQLRDIFDRLFAKSADGSKPLYYDLAGNDPDSEIKYALSLAPAVALAKQPPNGLRAKGRKTIVEMP